MLYPIVLQKTKNGEMFSDFFLISNFQSFRKFVENFNWHGNENYPCNEIDGDCQCEDSTLEEQFLEWLNHDNYKWGVIADNVNLRF